MSAPFVAEIRIFGFNFAPTGWATCDGQLQPISQNTALFSLLGTFYGGDGKSTFAHPNLQGSAPVGQGQSSASGTQYFIGEQSGTDFVTLIQTEMPVHSHTVLAQAIDMADSYGPANKTVAPSASGKAYQSTNAGLVPMGYQALSPAGGSLPHNNMMPYLTLMFCIALQGIFPARN